MKHFFITIRNIFSIEELRLRILNTLFFLLLFRLGSFVVLPGVDPSKLTGQASGIFGLLDTFLGGAFSNASIFGLGIMPYISASIVLQLLTVSVPYFQRLQREGESGRKKINQYTRFLTIFITMGQSIGYLATAIPEEAIVAESRWFFNISSMVILTAGTVFCMWIGERITEKGIGNGISMLIMVGIVSRFPGSLVAEFLARGTNQALIFVVEMLLLFAVVMGVILLVQGVRRIPVQYVKQMVGGKVYGGRRQYLPLKVNASGVMPIIFAQSLMFLPALLSGIWSDESDIAQYIGTTFSNITSWQYNLFYAVLIIVFTFFYTAITINPNQIADDMKRNGGFISGIKPGRDTSSYIDNVLTHITFPGALFLAMIAILPAFAQLSGVSVDFSQFYGGTSLLIMVGVILDTLQQIDGHLLMRKYEGMTKEGRMVGRTVTVIS